MLDYSAIQNDLRLGMAVIAEMWSSKTKDSITCIHTADINNDGKMEILVGSRDGRIRVLDEQGDSKWERIIGNKARVTAITVMASLENTHTRIFVGTQDGKLYVLGQDGKTIDRDGKTTYAFENGSAIQDTKEKTAYWQSYEYGIRYLAVNPLYDTTIIVGTDGHLIQAFDYKTQQERWRFPTKDLIQAVFSYDLDGDNKLETVVASGNKHLDILDDDGYPIIQQDVQGRIDALFVKDIDGDGSAEILLIIDGKKLFAFSPSLVEKWYRLFKYRLLSLCVTDINQDGSDEIILGTNNKYLYVLNKDRKELWREEIGYRVRCIEAIDFDHDGHTELLLSAEEDYRIHAININLVSRLVERITEQYQDLGRPSFDKIAQTDSLEYAFLSEIINGSKPSTEAIKLKQIQQQMEAKNYHKALTNLLLLEQQRVQPVWQEEVEGLISALSFGNISGDEKLEIIIATNKQTISAYNAQGERLWRLPWGSQIKEVYTVYTDHGRWAKILVLSADNQLYIINNSLRNSSGQPKITPIRMLEAISCFCVNTHNRNGPVEIIMGTLNNQILIYKADLKVRLGSIQVPHSVAALCAHIARDDNSPSIIVGSADKTIKNNIIYAYTRRGKLLWQYEIKGTEGTTQEEEPLRTLQLHLEDIDGDGNLEIIIGSGDRNVHVINHDGHLKWRYYLPDKVLTVNVAKLEDENWSIQVGCADNILYLFNRDGDLLWKYQTNAQIGVVRAADIDIMGETEIVFGSDDRLEVLQLVNQLQLQDLIQQCWSNLIVTLEAQTGKHEDILRELLQNSDPLIQAFALKNWVNQPSSLPVDFTLFEQAASNPSPKVRKALIPVVMKNYALNPQKSLAILTELSRDRSQNVQLAFVDAIHLLLAHNPQATFEYLNQFFRNMDRYGRRAIIRTLHHVIMDKDKRRSIEGSSEDSLLKIFNMLLLSAYDTNAYDGKSDWVWQEAARTLASFFDNYRSYLLTHIQRLIIKGVHTNILLQIAYSATQPLVQNIFFNLVLLLDGLNNNNVLERLQTTVKTLSDREVRTLIYGEETLIIFKELLILFNIYTLDEIACYRRSDSLNKLIEFYRSNTKRNHFTIVAPLFIKLNAISRVVGDYLRRKNINDRSTALLEAITTIDKTSEYVEQAYANTVHDASLLKLPDHTLFVLLLQRWKNILNTKMFELRGLPEINAELKIHSARHEEQIAFWLTLSNEGSASAYEVRVRLLTSSDFSIVTTTTGNIDILFSQDEIPIEFCIKPYTNTPDLAFEISYKTIGNENQEPIIKLFNERLELLETQQEFKCIPNPYSMGTPVQDDKMFFGRENDIAFLKDNLTRPEAKSIIILYGQRRSGKTTLLQHLVHTSILSPHIPILVDMQQEAYQMSVSTLLHNIAFYIFKAFRQRGITINKPVASEFERQATFAFNIFLEEAETQLTDQKIIVFVDEFEVMETQVKEKHLNPEFFGYLRSLMQHHRSINFLLSGTHSIEKLTRDYWSVFFNIALHYPLSHLNRESAIALITQPVAGYLEYEPYVIDKILDLTDGQPYLLHLACRSLVDHCNEKSKAYVTINDVNIVLREVMQTGQFHFDWLWNQLEPEMRIVLAILAEGGKEDGRALSLIELEEIYRRYYITFKNDVIVLALKALVDIETVKIEADHQADRGGPARYSIPVGLIRIWLLKEKSLEVVLREEVTKEQL